MVAFLRLGLQASRISLSPWTPLVLPRLYNNYLYWQTTTRTNPWQNSSRNLAIQSEFTLGMPGSEPALKRMCQQISSVYMSIMTKEESVQATKLPKEQWSNFHKANPVTFNDVILADLLTPLQVEAGKIERRLQYDRTVTDRNKRILSECANIPRRPHVCDRCGV